MRRLLLAPALLAFLPAAAAAQDATISGFQAGDRQLTLSGTGSNDDEFESGSFGLSAGLSYFLTDAVELGIRQDVIWADSGEGADSIWNGTTRLAADYNFDFGRFRPFVGAVLGYTYGDSTNETGIIGPEAGLKYFVNTTTFVYGQTTYQIFFDEGSEIEDNFDDGSWAHTVGIGLRF